MKTVSHFENPRQLSPVCPAILFKLRAPSSFVETVASILIPLSDHCRSNQVMTFLDADGEEPQEEPSDEPVPSSQGPDPTPDPRPPTANAAQAEQTATMAYARRSMPEPGRWANLARAERRIRVGTPAHPVVVPPSHFCRTNALSGVASGQRRPCQKCHIPQPGRPDPSEAAIVVLCLLVAAPLPVRWSRLQRLAFPCEWAFAAPLDHPTNQLTNPRSLKFPGPPLVRAPPQATASDQRRRPFTEFHQWEPRALQEWGGRAMLELGCESRGTRPGTTSLMRPHTPTS